MPSPYVVPLPKSSPYEFVGEPAALGSLSLTKLARSFMELETSDISDLFPDEYSPERTIVIEMVQEGMGLMPIVQPGVPAGNFQRQDRIFRRIVEPAHFREDDFIDQYLINQLRKVGTYNEAMPPEQIVQNRVQKMIARHNRTLDYFRTKVLLGGIDYTDPRTDFTINVPTQIPKHNLFKYDGYDSTVASGTAIPWGGVNWTANSNLVNDKGRTEALLFSSADRRVGVPWTDPDADIIRCLRLIKQYLKNTNKNQFTEIIMSGDFYTVLQENNYLKAYMGSVGTINFDVNATDKGMALASALRQPPVVSFGPGGDITQIAGLNIRVVSHLFTDPVDERVKNMWPSNKVVLVAKNHINDASQIVGRTQFCVGESPDGKPGLWMRTGPDQMPPAVPGRTMQMGNSFLPYAMYPHWIAILDVCDPADVDDKLILRSDIDYGIF